MIIMKANENSEAGMVLRALLSLMVTVSFAVDAWAQAGYVHASPGSVTIQSASGAPVARNVGDPIVPGSAIRTGDAGGTVLKFADGLVISLSPNSSLRISQYQFDPKNVKASRVSVELLDGGMRFVGGVIAAENRDALRIFVGAYTIAMQAVGGLDFSSVIDAKAAPDVVIIAVTTGEIALRTSSGAVASIGPSQVISARSGQAFPSPIPLAAAPAAIQAEMAALRSVILPNNNPVVVDTAARAVAALASAARVQAAAAASRGDIQLQAEAQSAAELAAAAAKAAATAAENLLAMILESTLAALPATAVGPAPALLVQPVIPPTSMLDNLPSLAALIPIPIPPMVTAPGQGGRCIGSPC